MKTRLKLKKMYKKVLVSLALVLGATLVTYSQACKVELAALQGSYEGECVKGVAEGKGTARGKDIYIGEFKKGLPHGRGVYQWSTGETYFGDFKKGQRDGLGVFTYFENGREKSQKGQWKIDRFIMEDIRASYHVREEFGIFNQRAVRSDDGGTVMFYFEQKGQPDKTVKFKDFKISSGEFRDVTQRSQNTMVMFDKIETFPVVIRIEYSRKSLDTFLDVNCVFEIELYEQGIWEFHLEHYR
jgi:hypothetical protein